MALVHDGFGGYIEESELPEDYVHGGYVSSDTVAQIAQDAVDTLADLVKDIDAQEHFGPDELGWQELDHYQEELAILRQRLKEATDAVDN